MSGNIVIASKPAKGTATMRLHLSLQQTSRLRVFRSLILAGLCTLPLQGHAENNSAEKQYLTALLTAISAAEVNNPQMASFANKHLHQASYCLYLSNPKPLQTIAHLTRSLMNNGNQKQLAHFEKIKTSFDMEYVRGDHPCLQGGSYPEDRV
jgi:hypothetical protein